MRTSGLDRRAEILALTCRSSSSSMSGSAPCTITWWRVLPTRHIPAPDTPSNQLSADQIDDDGARAAIATRSTLAQRDSRDVDGSLSALQWLSAGSSATGAEVAIGTDSVGGRHAHG